LIRRWCLPAPRRFYKTNAQNQWERIANVTVSGATVSAQVTGFSLGEAGIERALPLRTWTLHRRTKPPFRATLTNLK
jgi:hypothetical protein